MIEKETLSEILLEWEERSTRQPDLTVDEFLRDRPALIPPFRQLLIDLGRLKPLLDPKPKEAPDLPSLEGRYRPYAFHAQGGIGQVFRARDGEVGRDVAIKLIRPDLPLSLGNKSRFVREAELTGRLEHPGIVPIYGLCKDGDGQPYYAMRFIEGDTFAKIIEDYHAAKADRGLTAGADLGERNVELRRLLRHFVAACETMAYAHQQNVIHRDLKPKNIMIGRFGETIVVDWGLAKNLSDPCAYPAGTNGGDLIGNPACWSPEQVASQSNQARETPKSMHEATVDQIAGAAVTKSGDLLGTPAFMSPEQAEGAGDGVGLASDVYSLGATLYQVLTGRSPFTIASVAAVVGAPVQNVNLRHLIEAVRVGRFPTPRSVNPAVSRALEAVCLKAMRPRPEDRYQSAKELAADVERWLADEPVTAWREPFRMRARRWVKRNRSLVSAGTAVLLVLGASVAIAAGMLERKNRLLANEIETTNKLNGQLADAARVLEGKNAELATEINAKNRLNAQLTEEKAKLQSSFAATRDNFDLADRSIVYFVGVINMRLPGGAAIANPIRDAVNTEARDYYRRFIADNAQRAELRLELAFAHLRQAEAEIGLNNETGAQPLLDDARKRFEVIRAASSNDPHARYGLGCVDLNAAIVLIHQLKVEEARKPAIRACETFAKLCGEKPPAGRWFTGLEAPAFKLGQAVMSLRDVDARTDPRKEMPFAPEVKATDDGRVLPFAWIAEKALTAEFAANPDLPIEARGIFGLILMCLGEELAIRNHDEEGIKALKRARTELAILVKEFPAAYEIETMLYIIDFYLAIAAGHDSKGVDIKPMTQVRDRLRELGNRNWGPDRFANRNRAKLFAAQSSMMLGKWAGRSNRELALRHYREALDELEHVAPEKNKPDLATRVPLFFALANVLEGMNTLEEDAKLIKKLLERWRNELAEMEPGLANVPWFQRERIYTEVMIGMTKMMQEPPEKDGLLLLKKAVPLLREFVKKHPEDTLAEFQLAVALSQYGAMRALLDNQIDGSLKDLAEARVLVAKYPADGIKADYAKKMTRILPMQIASIHYLKAEQLLEGKDPDRKKKALVHINAALDELADIEKTDRLNDLEKRIRASLQLLKRQAG